MPIGLMQQQLIDNRNTTLDWRSPMKRQLMSLLLGAALAASGIHASVAQEFKVGLSADIATVDPHFMNQDALAAVSLHMYETLVGLDGDARLVPSLAVSWKAINNTTWEFKLRKGVKFHNGDEMTAEDVAFSIDRPATLKTSPAPYTGYTKAIVDKKIVDPYTIQFTTATPYPLLPNDLNRIFIVNKKQVEKATTEDFNLGKVEAGTGPFKLVKYSKGQSIELARNDNYWGDKPAWAKVTLKMLPNDPARMSALLSGDVQAVEKVQANLVPKFKFSKDTTVFGKPSTRVLFMFVDVRDTSPYVTDKSGKKLDKNPLKDVRVRQAMSKLIDRNVLTEKTLDKLGLPTANIAAPGMFGYNPNLKPDAVDIEGAKKLLAEAGYPDGFGITFFAPNDRFINGEEVALTIGQMLSKGGISTKVETMPFSTFLPRASKKELGLGLLGWGVGGGEPSGALRALIATTDKDKGMGAYNWASYSNQRFDNLLLDAMHTVDDGKREKLLQDAAEVAIKDYAVIPLYNQVVTWAVKKGIKYTPRSDELTLAQHFKPE
jgi:peptide/nickel transport system substrate-binding protein